MALVHDTTNGTWTGLAADTKPVTGAHIGETFYETDTGKTYSFTNHYTGGWSQVGLVPSGPVAIAALPAAAAGNKGARAFVTDALAPVFGSAVAAAGAVNVPVYSTGAAWFVG
jgi:hypothetical protein